MDTEKLGLLVDRLSAADAAGKLRWARGISSKAYQASFPSSTVILEHVALDNSFAGIAKRLGDSSFSPAAPRHREGLYLRVLDGASQEVAEISVGELEAAGDHQRAELIKKLYERARYDAGGERVIDELLANLAV